MNGSTLTYLAAVADLARLDLEAASVTLRCKDGQMRSIYAGNYAGGSRVAKVDNVADFSISVPAARFKTLVGMFGDEESVSISRSERRLNIRSRSSSVSMQELGELSRRPDVSTGALEFSARLSVSSLISEIDAASGFAADSYIKRSLTGIRIDFEPSKIRIVAFDGFGALFISEVKAKVSGTGSIVVPREDFLLGAKLMGEGDTVFGKPKNADVVVMLSASAVFRASLYPTDWPDINKVTDSRQDAGRFQIDAGQIRNLVAGSKALECGPDIQLTPNGKKITFSAQSESGAFTTVVKGRIPVGPKYDRETLAKIVKLGPVLDFYLPDKIELATRVESDHRRCWITTRI